MIRKYLLTVMLIFAVTAGAWAQEDNENKDTVTMSDQAKAFQLASSLAKYGYANNSASSLIEAAKIIKETGIKDAKDMQPEHENAETTTSNKNSNFSLDADKLLADATQLAAGDKNLLALVDNVKKAGTRGGGSVWSRYDRVQANSSDAWAPFTRSSGWYEFIVDGDGDTDLDLYVYERPEGCKSCSWTLIGKDIDPGDFCYVKFYSGGFSKEYRAKVKNLGSVYNDYTIVLK